MHRRDFLTASASAAFALAAGCGRRDGGPPISEADLARIEASKADRHAQGQLAVKCRVAPNATRTTPKPPADVLAVAPELKGLTKVAVRLHPRFSDEPFPRETKLGGRFLWPDGEPWPTCEEHQTSYVPVLQLLEEDAPPQCAYRPGTDVMQLLWCPRDHGSGTVKPAVVWRKRTAVGPSLAEPPLPPTAFLEYVPFPNCRLFPERVTEFPPLEALPKVVRDKLAAWTPPPHPGRPDGKSTGPEFYADLLSVADGFKAGGYPHWAGPPGPTACEKCGWPGDLLVTAAAAEWNDRDWPRWMPVEEQPMRAESAGVEGYRRAAGLNFGEGGVVNLFVCRRCEDWPVRVG